MKLCYQEQFNMIIRLENVLKTLLQDVLKISCRRLKNVLKTPWRHFCKTSWRCLEDVFKTSSRRIYWSCSSRLEDLFWRRMRTVDIFVLIKTSWRRLVHVFWRRRWKTCSRRVQDVFIKTNVCWNIRYLIASLDNYFVEHTSAAAFG